MNVKLSVVIPVFNERKRFKDGFNHYYSYLKHQKYKWELIFVNDGSTDKTLNLIKEVKKGKPNIHLFSYDKNKGKGYAVCQGVRIAKGEFILFADIDHSVSIETVESFFNYFNKGHAVVIGSRRVKGSVIAVHQNFLREFLGSGFTAIVNFLIYPGISDATCGFKAFKKNTAKKLFEKITIFNWAFDAELLFICRKNKIRVAQAPVRWRNVSGSKVSLKKDVINSLLDVVKIRINNLFGKYN